MTHLTSSTLGKMEVFGTSVNYRQPLCPFSGYSSRNFKTKTCDRSRNSSSTYCIAFTTGLNNSSQQSSLFIVVVVVVVVVVDNVVEVVVVILVTLLLSIAIQRPSPFTTCVLHGRRLVRLNVRPSVDLQSICNIR